MQYGGYSVLFLGAVMISARYGGLRSGLAATLLSVICLHYFFIPPSYSLVVRDLSSLIWLVMFALVAFLISSLNESRKRAEEKLRMANQELEARVADRTAELSQRNEELQNMLAQMKVLKGMLPICTNCKRIRDTSGHWAELESYLSENSEATFNQSICPACAKMVYPKYPFSDGSS
jgi:K+-sensing histidine kinase KdpD